MTDDMSTFEHQVATELGQMAGPGRHIDAMSMVLTVSTQSPNWRFQSVFSVTKLVIAGAIVALFGGLLLAGALTQPRGEDVAPAAVSPSPMTTDELLSSMVTEGVEPGVYRVLDDNAGHDLVVDPPVGAAVAWDGSVWLVSSGSRVDPLVLQADAVLELGRDGTFPFEDGAIFSSFVDLDVGPDGALWVGPTYQSRTSVRFFDGSIWSYPTWPDGSSRMDAMEATADGTIWVTRRVVNGPGPRVARITDGEWSELPTLDDPAMVGNFGSDRGGFGYFAADADGAAWLANGDLHSWDPSERTPSPDGLLHYDGTRWEVVELPTVTHDGKRLELPADEPWKAGPLALGTDGTLWVYLIKNERPSPTDWNHPLNGHLARLDADGWSLFTAAGDGVPLLVEYNGLEAPMAVDGTGTLWVAPEFGGILAFDGSSWRRYLGGLFVSDVDVGPDGSVLATAWGGCASPELAAERYAPDYDWTWEHPCWEPEEFDPSQAGLYVINPEAVAPTE